MDAKEAKIILDKVVGQVFGYENPFTLDQFVQKYAFDIRLPQAVTDSTTGEETWTQTVNPTKFISMENAYKREDWDNRPKKPINSMQDILDAWNEINYTATSKQLDSINIAQSDSVMKGENVFRSNDCGNSKNLLFCDGIYKSEFIAAGQRAITSNFCIRIEDSSEVSNSFSISWSKKIVNGLFLHNCYDMYECMFCSHIEGKKFCIANMQFEEEEYMKIKDMVIRWALTE
ncbi:MAG: hypothetical protein AAB632_02525 [Patescibacteria group bacterium]